MRVTKIIQSGLSIILFATLVTALHGQATTNQPLARPSITVEFENECLSLAKGYELAFRKLPSGGKYIEVMTKKGPQYLRGSVRSVEALEGILLIKMEKGLMHAINAKDIIKLTNDKPTSR